MPSQWNQYGIEVNANIISVTLNGQATARYTIAGGGYTPIPHRGQYSPNNLTFVSLQSCSNYATRRLFETSGSLFSDGSAMTCSWCFF